MASADRDALLALYNATDGANWGQNANWNTDADISRWHGIVVNDQGRVVQLNLFGNNLRGAIPKELGALGKLQRLVLVVNKLTGSIPKELGGLSELQGLYLFSNQLTGPIPKELGTLTKLERLWLHNNQLSGHIPKELGALSKLKELNLHSNQLTEIPPEVLELFRKRLAEPSWVANSWSRPPLTVLESGFERALGWWEDVKRFGEGKSNKLKMVLVGLADAGKTTVVRNFTGMPVPKRDDRTVGIEITPDWRPLDAGPLQISIWDFAGQADYYSSHQLFLTEGALFLLVVDLYAFSNEVQSGVDNFTDPHGRIYWWLEMLHMRVPGAAIALVGSHVDDMEKDGLDADLAARRLRAVVSNFIQDKAKKASKAKSNHCIDTESTTTMEPDNLRDGVQVSPRGDRLVERSGSRTVLTKPLVLHDHVFKVSRAQASVVELREWIVDAASGQNCPGGFHFPAVDQAVSNAWIEAYNAMDVLKQAEPCVLWSKAVDEFSKKMGGNIPDAGALLLRAMQHREAEGGVLLSFASASAPAAADLLHLDPAWLIELVRRLADHNLVDKNEKMQGTIEQQLRAYAELRHLYYGPLREMHREYRKSGLLNLEYLRFLWMHRKIDPPGSEVDLDDLKFESIVSTMTRLLVMYKVRGGGNFVVPARLPEYGNQNVLDEGNIVEIVVEIKCSFGQQYPPPGIIGRFLAWLTDVDHYGECWQHGAFLSYNKHEVFLYESEDCEPHKNGTESKFAGITLSVQGVRTEAREVLTKLKKSLEQLVSDSAYGYPGLAPLMSFEEPVETKSTELGELRRRLDNLDERLEKIERKLDGVANQVAEQLLFAASATQDMCPYPRLVILVPVDDKLPVDDKSGTRGQFQRKGWIRWKEAWEKLEGSVELNDKFSLRFLCEYNLTEVPCGPDGRGYLLEEPKEWVKKCIPLMQASLWILRTAVGFVSNVDLPMNEVLGAAVNTTGAALVDGIGTEVPSTINTDGISVLEEGEAGEKIKELKRLQGPAYEFLCEFMRKMEAPPPRRCFGCLPRSLSCHRQSSQSTQVTGPTQSTGCWKDKMVQERNGNGGWAWVLRDNQKAYVRDRDAASAASVGGPSS
ncbi:unnamed protein product [Pylaiella littoralis]